MQTLTVLQARRAYMRALYGTKFECIQRARFEEAEMARDGGEFSHPPIYLRWERKKGMLLELLAPFAGLSSDELANEFYALDYIEVRCEP